MILYIIGDSFSYPVEYPVKSYEWYSLVLVYKDVGFRVTFIL